jgi:hypothetical protein
LHNQEDTKILNVLNASNLFPLINDKSFLKLLQDNFATNVIIVNKPEGNLYVHFTKKHMLIEMNLVGKNILIRLFNDDIILFETIIDKSGLFVEWRPVF